MGWKKDFKKFSKKTTNKSSIFDYSENVSSNINWERSIKGLNYWNIDNLIIKIEFYNRKIKEILLVQKFPNEFKDYSWNFKKIDITEKFYSYPMTSYFQNIYNFVNQKIGSYEASLVLMSISKFTYFTTLKFWKIFNHTFSNKDINEKPLLRVFEVMQRTGLDSIENILEKILLIIDNKKIDLYKQHLIVEEIIDLGDDFTYHWSRMFDQVIDLTVETFLFQNKYGKTTSSTYSNIFEEEKDFEDFFEKTKTMVFNDEVNEAFAYFEITKMAKPDEFKKIYRKYAKKFHPDVNSDPNSSNEMKKINVFKTIIEQYYEKYEII
ncbi:DnaJ domain-containing protein [Spiroplasma taiwanense]|uniref:J domain-containing protein n=1 Tax=Spiroplasma taiwanense CT-1 TaxID=1276220 RepID=S5MAU0_9MOLU|nr:DnaJ domain-containing protein [Spiroplasma taiwanense]AGR40883.1 hypothetical protein STAIW_v1c02060 [Spiroplasma taiwanense CT-1]